MKVLHVSSYDINGGAAIAAYRLHKSLLNKRIESRMLVMRKEGDLPTVHSAGGNVAKWLSYTKKYLDSIPNYIYRKRAKVYFSNLGISNYLIKYIKSEKPDIIHLHWINDGFVNISQLKKVKVPIVWTLHDMWSFTGGCHYTGDCTKFTQCCGKCPLLGSKMNYDLSTHNIKKKVEIMNKVNINIVTCSNWLKECASQSQVLKDKNIYVIPNTLNTNLFKPIDKKAARSILNLPLDAKIILFGAVNPLSNIRKGYKYLIQSLNNIKLDNSKILLCVFGASTGNLEEEVPYNVRYMGVLRDELSLALHYSAADVFVAPSIEDNLPNTVMESLACGTPVVSFKVGGLTDMVKHNINGYVASFKSSEDLAKGIIFIIENSEVLNMNKLARESVMKKYTNEIVSSKYIDLYNSMLNKYDR